MVASSTSTYARSVVSRYQRRPTPAANATPSAAQTGQLQPVSPAAAACRRPMPSSRTRQDRTRRWIPRTGPATESGAHPFVMLAIVRARGDDMRVLVATSEGQGTRPGDYCWTIEGEIVLTGPLLECADPQGCGCGRGFPGLGSARATTTAAVVDRAGISVDDLRRAVRDSLDRQGWLTELDERGGRRRGRRGGAPHLLDGGAVPARCGRLATRRPGVAARRGRSMTRALRAAMPRSPARGPPTCRPGASAARRTRCARPTGRGPGTSSPACGRSVACTSRRSRPAVARSCG